MLTQRGMFPAGNYSNTIQSALEIPNPKIPKYKKGFSISWLRFSERKASERSVLKNWRRTCLDKMPNAPFFVLLCQKQVKLTQTLHKHLALQNYDFYSLKFLMSLKQVGINS